MPRLKAKVQAVGSVDFLKSVGSIASLLKIVTGVDPSIAIGWAILIVLWGLIADDPKKK